MTSMSAAEFLGLKVLENSAGEQLDAAEALKGKIVGLYFSATWCPPCQQFSPELDQFASDNAEDFVVVLVSKDQDEAAFLDYSAHKKSFLRVPFGDKDVLRRLEQLFEIYALPTLQILSPEGLSLTSWGRAAVTRNKHACVSQWRQGQSGAGWLSLLGLW